MTATRGTTRTIAIAGGFGVASGLLSYLVPEAFSQIGVDQQGAVLEWSLRLWPGIIFGAAIGFYLKSVDLTSTARAAAFVPLGTAAWYAALWFAINGPDKLGFPFKEAIPVGIASGLIGAGLVALSALLLFPFFRRWKSAVATIVAGGIAGILLIIGVDGWMLVILFAVWQGAVASCFGWAVTLTQRAS